MNISTRLNLVYALSTSLLVLAPLTTNAAKSKGFVAGPQYFYPVLQDPSDATSAYQIPECAKLPDAEYKKIKRQCEAMGENAKRCPTEKTVTIETSVAGSKPTQSTKESPNKEVMKEAQKVEPTTKTMKLSYIVFVSLDECKTTREHELEGD